VPKYFFYFFLFLIPTISFSQEAEKKILFHSDSIWYASQNHVLFSSINKGEKWDTIFGKRDSTEIVFFEGDLDTARNVFISDQHTIFVFGWDGTMLYKTILYCSSDGGKTWNKSIVLGYHGTIGVKYLHKISSGSFFLYLRNGFYVFSQDAGKTWTRKCMTIRQKFKDFDPQVSYKANGDMYLHFTANHELHLLVYSTDGGITWFEREDK
jgi:hypothetical protein